MKDALSGISLETLADTMRPLAGQVVLLYGTDLARLHGVAEDHMDLYYVVESRGGGYSWSSAVGHVVPLKDRLGSDYDELDAQFTRDGVPPTPFQVIREERFRKVWIEGRDHRAQPGKGWHLALAAKLIESIDRAQPVRGRLRHERLIGGACDLLDRRGEGILKDDFRGGTADGWFDAPQAFGRWGALRSMDAVSRRRQNCEAQCHDDRQASISLLLQRYAELTGFDTFKVRSFASGIAGNTLEDFISEDRSAEALEWELHSIAHRIHGRPADRAAEESEEGVEIIAAITKAYPEMFQFITAWLESMPSLVDVLVAKESMPLWYPAACFCLDLEMSPGGEARYAIDPEVRAMVLDDFRAAGIEPGTACS